MSFVGLWSIWAGLGRPNWFVRISVVLGWISLVVVIPAYELLIMFLAQAGVAIAILSVWRAWRSSRIMPADPDGLSFGQPPRCRWQYSILDMMLLTVLVAWLSAMLVRVPAQVWTQWYAWLETGAIAGGVAPVAAWIALSKRRWWLRLPVCCVLFPSVLVVIWLMLARSARFACPNSGRSFWKTWAARAALTLVSLLMMLPPAAVYWRLATPLPIPHTTLPNPNGYDDLVQAGKMLQTVTVPDAETATHAQLKTFDVQAARVYDLVHSGLAKSCQVPLTWYDPQMASFSAGVSGNTNLRQLARGFCDRAKLAELDGRIDNAVAADLDTIRLGRACAHGGLLDRWFLDDCFEGMGREGICRLRKSLSKEQCAALVPVIQDLVDHANSLEETFEREAVWQDNALGWSGHLINLINAITGADEAMFRQMCVYAGIRASSLRQMVGQSRDRDLAKMRLLICDLAIRAYSLEHGRNPAKLADLVPAYLPAVPQDPFSGGPLVYRLKPTGYLLYGVGVDGVDDGGRSSGPGGLEDGGDILLDDPPSPPTPPKTPGS
jgi:hypothetical protein